MSVRVTGLRETMRSLEQAGAEIDDLKGVMSDIADEGARLASSFAPRRSGRLAGSIRGNRAKSKAVVAAGGRGAPYAGVINFGWPARRIAASSFMQRADKALEPRVIPMLEAGIDEVIRSKGLQ